MASTSSPPNGYSQTIDTLPPELKVKIFELLAPSELMSLLALSSITRTFHDVYLLNQQRLLSMFADNFFDEWSLTPCQILASLPRTKRTQPLHASIDIGKQKRALDQARTIVEKETGGPNRFSKMGVARIKELIDVHAKMRFMWVLANDAEEGDAVSRIEERKRIYFTPFDDIMRELYEPVLQFPDRYAMCRQHSLGALSAYFVGAISYHSLFKGPLQPIVTALQSAGFAGQWLDVVPRGDREQFWTCTFSVTKSLIPAEAVQEVAPRSMKSARRGFEFVLDKHYGTGNVIRKAVAAADWRTTFEIIYEPDLGTRIGMFKDLYREVGAGAVEKELRMFLTAPT